MLRQAENSVEIEGILSEVKLEKASYTPADSAVPVDCIRGSIIIRVNQEIDKKPTVLEVPVHFFTNRLTKAGAENKIYSSLTQFMDNAVSIAACGDEDKADRVRLTSASIGMNEWYDSSRNMIRAYPKINGTFITRISKADCKQKATFSTEFYIGEIKDEVNKDGDTTGRMIISAILPQYNENVDVVPFICSSPNVINVISQNWQSSDSVRATGKLNFSYSVEEYEEPVDFGEPNIKQRTVNISELIITGGSQAPLDENIAFNSEDVRQAMIKRKTRHEGLKEKALKKNSTSAPANKPSSVLSDF